MTLTAMAMQPRSCPCCWDRKNGCLAECMPFSLDTGGAFPSMDGEWECCLSNALASWAAASESEICTKIRDNGGDGCVYATAPRGIDECADAGWQALMYCVEDAEGTNGRAWIVDLLIRVGTGPGSVTTLTSRVLDWVCTCDGARFEWAVEGEIPECDPPTVEVCTDCDGVCVSVPVPAFAGTPSGWTCNLPTGSTVNITWVGPSSNVVFSADVVEPGGSPPTSGWRYFFSIRCISGTNRMRIAITYTCFDTGLNVIATYDGPVGACVGTFNLVSETGGGTGWAAASIIVTAC